MAWQKTFAAMSVLLDGAAEPAMAALPAADRAEATALLAELTHESRAVRAKALATELANVARALEAVELGT